MLSPSVSILVFETKVAYLLQESRDPQGAGFAEAVERMTSRSPTKR